MSETFDLILESESLFHDSKSLILCVSVDMVLVFIDSTSLKVGFSNKEYQHLGDSQIFHFFFTTMHVSLAGVYLC